MKIPKEDTPPKTSNKMDSIINIINYSSVLLKDFGWATIGKHLVPYILRSSKKWCLVHMVELKLLNQIECVKHLHNDLFNLIPFETTQITATEYRLLLQIYKFTCKYEKIDKKLNVPDDLLIQLSDVQKLYRFIQVCSLKLIERSCKPSDECGFIEINNTMVPYVEMNYDKYVPVVYFENELKEFDTGIKLKQFDWSLVYLRLCATIQGDSKEFLFTDTCSVIDLTRLKEILSYDMDMEFKYVCPEPEKYAHLLLNLPLPSPMMCNDLPNTLENIIPIKMRNELTKIPEFIKKASDPEVPFNKHILVIDNIMVPCINSFPYITWTNSVISLRNVMHYFFNSIALSHFLDVLNELGIKLYYGNSYQLALIQEFGCCKSEAETVLMQAKDLIELMPQIEIMCNCRPKLSPKKKSYLQFNKQILLRSVLIRTTKQRNFSCLNSGHVRVRKRSYIT